MQKPRALLSWSSGKDAAWTLHTVQASGQFQICGLLTTLNEAADRVAMHAVRRSLLEAQARAAALPLHTVGLPAHCSNAVYQARLGSALDRLKAKLKITHIVFGDLFLADVKAYREAQMATLGLVPVFPLFGRDTQALARDMIAGGLRARLSCVDSEQLAPAFCGRHFDASLLDEIPASVDPCGEQGEFHTLVTDGPMFHEPLQVRPGARHVDGQFHFMDFMAA